MFDKSVGLNFKISAKEFGLGTGLAVFSGLMIYQEFSSFPFSMSNGVLSLIGLLGLVASLVFYIMGFHKLLYKSLFFQEANLYMSLPISNLQVVLSKIFVGTFWVLVLVGILVFSIFTSLMSLSGSEGFFSYLISSLIVSGLPAQGVGLHMVLLLWADILSSLVFVATLLFAIIFANTLRSKRFKLGIHFLVVPACFIVNGLIFYTTNQRLDLSLISLVVPLLMLLVFIYLSERLLTKKYHSI